jgi:hypothetical protein
MLKEVLNWLETFSHIRKMIVVFGMGGRDRLSEDAEFLIPNKERSKFRGRMMTR